MKYCLITFRSVTPAQRGESILKRAAVTAVLQRTPRWMEERGCGYSLRLGCRELPAAVQLLRRHKIAFQKVYTVTQEGDAEEWIL